MRIPGSWIELLDRLGSLFDGDDGRRDAEEWLRCAVEATWGTLTLHDLDRASRQIAFQKSSGVLLRLEEEGIPDVLVAADGDLPSMVMYRDGSLEPLGDYPGRRAQIQAAVARYFNGQVVDGPPWRISPLETDRPAFADFAASADFG